MGNAKLRARLLALLLTWGFPPRPCGRSESGISMAVRSARCLMRLVPARLQAWIGSSSALSPWSARRRQRGGRAGQCGCWPKKSSSTKMFPARARDHSGATGKPPAQAVAGEKCGAWESWTSSNLLRIRTHGEIVTYRKESLACYACKARKQFKAMHDSSEHPLESSMPASAPEFVGSADGETVRVERMMIDKIGPELILVVPAQPDIAPRTIFGTTSRGINGP